MNILVIGNGFDLAHGLPTKYTDFLEFCNVVDLIYKSNKNYTFKSFEIRLLDWSCKREIKEALKKDFQEYKKGVDNEKLKSYDIYTYINNNAWIEYFMDIYKERIENGKDGWIDFESEISQIIMSITDVMIENGHSLYDQEINFRDGNTYNLYQGYIKILELIKKVNNIHVLVRISYLDIRNHLLNDLNRLIYALEIYLRDFLNKVMITKVSKDIKNLDIDCVLSFNYTDTYNKLYDKNSKILYDYIHGKADINNTIDTNNMVLGIDEYLSKKRRNKDTEFIAFKKYYQRIHKQTGCRYKEWMDEIKIDYKKFINNQRNLNNQSRNGVCYAKNFTFKNMKPGVETIVFDTGKYEKHNLYIFGHSLDITDKDILRDLILNDNVYTTIYYPDKEELGRKIANLVKVIGQDELIRRTGGSTKTIEFKKQQEMEEIR